MEPQDLQNEFTFIRTFLNELSIWGKYGQNALAMFVMQFYLHLDNVESFASDAITDGGNDKKIDLCHIDLDEGRAIIGQCYLSPNWGKEAAKANKASDINTGISWLLSAIIDRVPEVLRPKAQELRDGLSSGEISRIEVLFIHNQYSSGNVAEELEAAANAAYDLSSRITAAAGLEAPTVSYREFGLQEIQYLYQSIDSDIMINDWLRVPVDSWISEEGNTWKAVVASVPASWIRELRLQHGDDLVSANFRNYLGIRKRKDNINHQIRQTVIAEPENFWVFNNGITALTHELNITEDGVNIRGISIINGAQTSGAIGESDEDKASDATVLFRVVACEREALINKIILYNNTQNKIISADRRSNETILQKLQTDFDKYGISFVIRRSHGRNPRNSIISADIARVLAAFHGDPQLGYRNPSTIFDEDKSFQSVFPHSLSSEHVFLVFSLAKAYDEVKSGLKAKAADGSALEVEEKMYEVLKFTSSRYFVIFIIGSIAEQLKGQRIPDLRSWKARTNVVLPEAERLVRAWRKILEVILPLLENIIQGKGENAAFEVPRSQPLAREVANQLRALVQAIDANLNSNYSDLRSLTEIS